MGDEATIKEIISEVDTDNVSIYIFFYMMMMMMIGGAFMSFSQIREIIGLHRSHVMLCHMRRNYSSRKHFFFSGWKDKL